MAITSTIKSTVITNLDSANPPQTRPDAGAGAPGTVRTQWGTCGFTSTLATTAALRLVRIPTNAVVKAVRVGIEANGATVTTVTGYVGLLWSDNTFGSDGTTFPNAGSLTPASSAAFAYQVALAAQTNALDDITFQNAGTGGQTVGGVNDGWYVMSASAAPIWQALTQGGPYPQNSGTYAGLGAVTGSTNSLYQLPSDPGGFFDVFFQPSGALSVTAGVTLQMVCEVQYIGNN